MFSITVDKVNKRRRSIDFSADVAVALHERIQSDSADHERVIGKQSVIPTTAKAVIVADRRRRGPVVPISEFTTTITEWVLQLTVLEYRRRRARTHRCRVLNLVCVRRHTTHC
jgi:hypothetical protein